MNFIEVPIQIPEQNLNRGYNLYNNTQLMCIDEAQLESPCEQEKQLPKTVQISTCQDYSPHRNLFQGCSSPDNHILKLDSPKLFQGTHKIWSKAQKEKYIIFYLKEFKTYPNYQYLWEKPKFSKIFIRMARFIRKKDQMQLKAYESTLQKLYRGNNLTFFEFIISMARKTMHQNPIIANHLSEIDQIRQGTSEHMRILDLQFAICTSLDEKIAALCENAIGSRE